MNLNEYQELSTRTMPNRGRFADLCNYSMGLNGEAGEVTDLLKKHLHHNHQLDRMEAKKELGDVMHYVAGLCTLLGFSLEEVCKGNIEKLMKRYPSGFDVLASINRKE